MASNNNLIWIFVAIVVVIEIVSKTRYHAAFTVVCIFVCLYCLFLLILVVAVHQRASQNNGNDLVLP